jgi:LPS sulfotransferase NodH
MALLTPVQSLWQAVTGGYARGGSNPFVIVFLARTGSNYLAAMLDSHPEITCHHELFIEGEVHRALTYKGTDVSFGTAEDRERDPWGFLKRVFTYPDGSKAVGFKIAPRNNFWVVVSLMLNRRVRKIVLSRRNWLMVYTSNLIAFQTGSWSRHVAEAGRAAVADGRVHVDPAEFRRYAGKRIAFYRTLRTLLKLTGQRSFSLDYEDLKDPETLRRLLAFLGVSAEVPLTERTIKQNPDRLSDRIANYQEVAQALRHTRYAWMLDQDS